MGKAFSTYKKSISNSKDFVHSKVAQMWNICLFRLQSQKMDWEDEDRSSKPFFECVVWIVEFISKKRTVLLSAWDDGSFLLGGFPKKVSV